MPKLYDEFDCYREKKLTPPSHDPRGFFERDLSRLIHSPSFRKLSGKTQIFPGSESDYFRNRLSHSEEVADIGHSIALRINNNPEWDKQFKDGNVEKIKYSLVRFACLAHDMGHPPFGHVGERTLNECMHSHTKVEEGSEEKEFEGNAQTLRILARLEKKQTVNDSTEEYGNHGFSKNNEDLRLGLNLTYRSLASIIKYPTPIWLPNSSKFKKGYYKTESELFERIKFHVLKKYGNPDVTRFRTIECSIMELADDIAYTTYDLDDALKGGFINPFDFIAYQRNQNIRDEFLKKLYRALDQKNNLKKYLDNKVNEFSKESNVTLDKENVIWVLMTKYVVDMFLKTDTMFVEMQRTLKDGKIDEFALITSSSMMYNYFKKIEHNAYFRNKYCTDIINYFLEDKNFKFEPNNEMPALASVKLSDEALFRLECIKQFVFVSQVKANRIQMAEYRGQYIIKEIYKALNEGVKDESFQLLPEDYNSIYKAYEGNPSMQRRVLCDFIAGMTDKYAVEFYCRLYGENPQSFFKGT